MLLNCEWGDTEDGSGLDEDTLLRDGIGGSDREDEDTLLRDEVGGGGVRRLRSGGEPDGGTSFQLHVLYSLCHLSTRGTPKGMPPPTPACPSRLSRSPLSQNLGCMGRGHTLCMVPQIRSTGPLHPKGQSVGDSIGTRPHDTPGYVALGELCLT